jgi:hypothetical protein
LPVTPALLYLIDAIAGARQLFLSKGLLAESLNMAKPEDYYTQCEKLLFTDFALQCDKIGLKRNSITFKTIMRIAEKSQEMQIFTDMNKCEFEKLSKLYVFNP